MIVVGAMAFNQEHIITPWVKNASKYADNVLVTWSDKPWTAYNPKAAFQVKLDKTNCLLQGLLKENPKLTLRFGEWETQEDQRNDMVKIAERNKGDFFLIVDVDEFYFPEQIKEAVEWVKKQKKIGCWFISHYQFIKKKNWIIEAVDGLPKFQAMFELGKGLHFEQKRAIKPIAGYIPEEIVKCYHVSYYQPRKKLVEKLTCFGAAAKIRSGWLEKVWDNLSEDSKDFHPVNPKDWKRIKIFHGPIPDELTELNFD